MTNDVQTLVERLLGLVPFLEAHHCSAESVRQAATRLEQMEPEAETYRQMHGTAKELGYPSILEALEAIEQMDKALREVRAKFAEYVELHRAKLNDWLTTPERQTIEAKIARNQAMVDLCDAALG